MKILRTNYIFLAVAVNAFAYSQVGSISRNLPPNTIVVTSATQAGCQSAFTRAVNTPGPDNIYLPPGTITLTKPLPWRSGINWIGAKPLLSYTTALPDQDWAYSTGTKMVGDGTFPCFVPADGTFATYTGSSTAYYDNDVTVASVSFTNTSANILVNDATMWPRLSVGQFVTVTTTGNGFTAGATYYVKTKAGTAVGVDTIITLSTTVGGGAVTATGTATASVLLDWMNYAVTNSEIRDIAFDNFSSAVKAGAVNQTGALNCQLVNLYASNCGGATGSTTTNAVTKFAFDLKNAQHVTGYRLYANRVLGGLRITSDVKSVVLQCGNSYFEDVYILGTTSNLCRGIVISSSQAGSINQIAGQRLQVNYFNRTPVSDAGTPTNGTSNFTLTTPANAGRYPVGMPVSATSTVSGVTLNQVYWVKTNSGTGTGILTLSNDPSLATAITFSAGTGFTLKTAGMPNLELVGATSSDVVTGCTLSGLDLEGDASTSVSLYKANGNYLNVSSWGSTSNYAYFSLRSSQPNTLESAIRDAKLDLDSSSVNTYYTGGLNSAVQSSPIGIFKDSANDVVAMFSQYGKGIKWRNVSGGGFLLPQLAMGSNYTPWPYAAGTMNEGSGSTIVCYSQAATSITLPTISSNNIGWKCRIYNNNSGVLTINSGASEIMNMLTGKTALLLAPVSATDMSYADIEIQTVNGTNTYLVSCDVQSIGIGTATQLTSKATGTTLSAIHGRITMNSASLAANTLVSFTLMDTQIGASDMVDVYHESAGTIGAYSVSASPASGSATINVRNITAGALAEAIVLRFRVHKVN